MLTNRYIRFDPVEIETIEKQQKVKFVLQRKKTIDIA